MITGRITKWGVLVVSVVAAAGCNPVRISQTAGQAAVRGFSCAGPRCYDAENRDRLRHTNEDETYVGDLTVSYKWSYEKEWVYNSDGNHDRPPQLCLAMSGGGIRSAAFNIGVLSGLHDITDSGPRQTVLDRIDVMSAVSGGSSALAWYHVQHYHLDRKGKDNHEANRMMFDENGTHQAYLANHYRTFSDVEYYVGAVLDVSFAPVNFFANAIFGWHANTSPMRGWYEQRLRSTFEHDPLGPADGEAERVSVKRLGKFVRDRKLPFFVINTTALIERDFHHFGSILGNSVFEFNALNYGSDAFGRHPYEDAAGTDAGLSVGQAVSISSAAFDGSVLVSGPAQSVLWSLLNIDTGMYFNNPNLSAAKRLRHRLLPFPLYFGDHYVRDIHGTDIYLSDGGHAENLGAYGLVRRRCQKIIVIDAEHDPMFDFESYGRLRAALKREMGVSLEVGGIDRIRAIRDFTPLGERWKAAAQMPVTAGTISFLPYRGDDADVSDKVEVLYIKMAYDPTVWTSEATLGGSGGGDEEARRRIQARLGVVRKIDDQDRKNKCVIDPEHVAYKRGRCPFPHRTTKDQDFTPDEYRAWRNLGWLITTRYAETIKKFVGIP